MRAIVTSCGILVSRHADYIVTVKQNNMQGVYMVGCVLGFQASYSSVKYKVQFEKPVQGDTWTD